MVLSYYLFCGCFWQSFVQLDAFIAFSDGAYNHVDIVQFHSPSSYSAVRIASLLFNRIKA